MYALGSCTESVGRGWGHQLVWGSEPKEEWKTPTAQISALRLGDQPWAVCLPSSPSHSPGSHPGHPPALPSEYCLG